MKKRLFTSESVTMGHPDKVCDRISDAILDAILKDDKDARVACEVLATTGLVLVAGEIDTTTYVNIEEIVRETVSKIGYTRGKYGFDADNLAVLTAVHEQSPDIKQGVVQTDGILGAGDQGIMFGYACNETKNYMPLSLELAHNLVKRIDYVREQGILDFLRPDGKSQVTLEYDDNNVPFRVDTVVVSVQHKEMNIEKLREQVKKEIIYKVIPEELIDDKTIIHINPTGKFVIGGPKGDTGLTGRKAIVDTYGGYGRHGGGALSGKDPSKVDRSASYMARYLAKNIVASGLVDKCEVQLAYVIGVTQPVSINVETFNNDNVNVDKIRDVIIENIDLSPKGIIDRFQLKRPIYEQTAYYGHMGREDLDLPWEKLDIVDLFKKIK
ncbi:MAG TPA: methionine adenosyltransferase [Acholeplasma sp.]|jgi:S-adenosylmethionine synthetase|nr:methionine adenosyltransferase [Acholeplasma sp.]